MNKKVWPILGLFMFVLIANTFGQKFKVLEGDKEILKGQKEINIQFDYSHLGVGNLMTKQTISLRRKQTTIRKKAAEELPGKKHGKGTEENVMNLSL